MSINLIQRFVFETDDLKSFEKMLGLILDLSRRNKLKWVPLETQEECCWEDGKYEDHDFDQYSAIRIGEEFAVITSERTFHGTSFKKVLATFPTQEAAAKDACGRAEELKPLRKWVTTIRSQYREPGDKAIKVPFGQSVAKIMEMIKAMDEKKFLKEFAYVVPDYFDGSHGCGYRMEMDGGDDLHISLAIILYGK